MSVRIVETELVVVVGLFRRHPVQSPRACKWILYITARLKGYKRGRAVLHTCDLVPSLLLLGDMLLLSAEVLLRSGQPMAINSSLKR